MHKGPGSRNKGDHIPLAERHTYTANLYQHHAPLLFAYLKRHTASVNDAEDILAEVFIAVLGHDLTEMGETEQRAWLWTIARNKINDYYRRRHRQPQISLADMEEIAGDKDPEEQALQQEEAAFLHGYLQSLSPIQQEVLQMRFAGELRCIEIATLLNKREGTIRSILSRALNELRKHYER
ncbi:RNA polymerase sigma factor [Dictyobacter kobayashii]|uniref:RNA polymerase sigma24 factor n=1 Tax=Dictyobacter kobayashii TaxID=2014872 RepID=A0A402ARP7_9CHLR|nr:RNA polymerase sigma factor [Dictyobacter kobayashii]GCE21769.1 RNA polymerase sigma24 factor [Dictyobacter kobayashii]